MRSEDFIILKRGNIMSLQIFAEHPLKGFSEAITTIFPKTEVQSCVVHQIRNSLKYVASKGQKAFMADLKPFYQAVSKDSAELQLLKLAEKWKKNTPSSLILGNGIGKN